MTDTLFHMWSRFREKLIAEHEFYMEQAQKRLLSQFENLEEEAHKYADEWLDRVSHHFDPDMHDPSGFYEQASEEGIEFYQMLSDMHNRTRLSVAAGMFHEWEKQLRSWIIKEINHWHRGDNLKKSLYKANILQLIELLEAFGCTLKSKNYFNSLDRCRLVVNVYKHGDGESLEDIKKLYPEFVGAVENDDASFTSYADYSDLIIEDSHIAEFSSAITEFWKDVPEYIVNRDSGFDIPKWFKQSYEKDIESQNKEKVA